MNAIMVSRVIYIMKQPSCAELADALTPHGGCKK
jgi:hypothetical protein